PGSSVTLPTENDINKTFFKICSFYFLSFIFILLSLFFYFPANAASIPVENVFSDITKDYKYHDELQTLYDK
ncbi:MAG: hypothetical protein LBD88_03050, partial [Candidatus Peribacteria bacterium]|nr:hypothetical protein [Candidatus Peribacteria bacterium]